MVEVFTTNIPDKNQAVDIIATLENNFSGLKISFDIEHKVINYPCDHSILRVKGDFIEIDNFISTVNTLGFECDILEDKLCRKQ